MPPHTRLCVLTVIGIVLLQTVYAKMVEINFFSYPSLYSVPTPASGAYGLATPSYRYRLMARNGDLTHTVVWEDNIFVEPTPPESERLRELFDLIRGMVDSDPDVQRLPTPQVGCLQSHFSPLTSHKPWTTLPPSS